MTSELEERLQACLDELAKILYKMADKSQLNDLSDVEITVRGQILEHVSPRVALFLSKNRHKQIQEKKGKLEVQ
jgi:hypothetical protein